jgi:hypothetical protein
LVHSTIPDILPVRVSQPVGNNSSLCICSPKAKEGLSSLLVRETCRRALSSFSFVLQDFNFSEGKWAIESLYFEVNRLVWTVFTLLLTVLRLQSSYFCMIWVLFPSLGRLILDHIYEKAAKSERVKGDMSVKQAFLNITFFKHYIFRCKMAHDTPVILVLSARPRLQHDVQHKRHVHSHHGKIGICLESRFAHRRVNGIDGSYQCQVGVTEKWI